MAALFAGGDGQVQFEELGEQVLLRVEAAGRQDGGVEGGVGVLQRVPARQLQRPVNGLQCAGSIRSAIL